MLGLGLDYAHGPEVYGTGILGRTEEELGRAVVARANVGDVGLALGEHLGADKVNKLEAEACGLGQQVVGLKVTVADALDVDVLEGL